MKYKIFLGRIAATLVAVLLFGCSNPSGGEDKDYFFYRVDSETTTVYLFGSIHLGSEDMYPLARDIESAFAESDVMVVEADAANLDPASAMRLVMLEEGSLGDMIADSTYEKLVEYFTGIGLPAAYYNRMKPWFAGMTVSMMKAREFVSLEFGVETYFRNKADEKRIVELESFEAQSELFDEIENKDLIANYMLADAETVEESLEEMTRSWKEGDDEFFIAQRRQMLETFPEFQALDEKIYDRRNEKMAEKIENFLKTDNVHFVIVGAGHLIGENSIPDILRKSRNFEVKRI